MASMKFFLNVITWIGRGKNGHLCMNIHLELVLCVIIQLVMHFLGP